MATPKWEYPDATTPTSTLEFPRGELQQDAPQYVDNNDMIQSDYGIILTRSKGSNYTDYPFTAQIPLATQSGNTVDIAKLRTFIRTTINYSQRPFYFTNRAGDAAVQVKLVGGFNQPVAVHPNHYEYRFILREVVS